MGPPVSQPLIALPSSLKRLLRPTLVHSKELLHDSHDPDSTVGQPILQKLFPVPSSSKRLSLYVTAVYCEGLPHISHKPVLTVGQSVSHPLIALLSLEVVPPHQRR